MTTEKVERRLGKGGGSDEMTPGKESNSSADRSIVYTVDEVAELFRCTRPTVYAMIRRGQLRSFKIGRLTRIPVADAHALVGFEPAA